jgi:hypothetical protein
LDNRGVAGDLVVVALPGVQRFLEEARSTPDVSAASGIYSALASHVVDSLGPSLADSLSCRYATLHRADRMRRPLGGTANWACRTG